MPDESLEATIELLKTQLLLRPNDPHKRFQLGNVLRKGGRMDQAIEAFTRAVTAKPDFADAHFQLGLIYREKNDPATALNYFHQAVSFKPDLVDAVRQKAETAAILERDDEALESYERVLELAPDDPVAPREAGIRRYRRNDWAGAAKWLDRAAVLEPDRTQVLVLLGLSQFRKGDMTAARNVLTEFIKRGGDSPVARKSLAEAHAGLNDAGRGVEVAREGLEKYPDDTPLWLTYGTLLAQRGQLEAAVTALQKASVVSSAELHSTLGHVLLKLHRHAEAAKHLKIADDFGTLSSDDVLALGEAHLGVPGSAVAAVAALERSTRMAPGKSRGFVVLGKAYLAVERTSDALTMLRRAESLGESGESLLLEIAALQDALDLGDEALATYGRVLDGNAACVPALFGVGRRVLALGHAHDAVDPLKECVRYSPEHADAYLLLGRALFATASYVEASAAFTSYLQIRPDDHQARMELAASLRAEGRHDQAIPVLQKAAYEAPSSGSTFRELGAVYAEANQPAPAADAYRRATEIAPEDPVAQTELARQLRALGELDGALSAVSKAIEQRPNDATLFRLRGLIHGDRGEDHRARGELERAHFLDPSNPELAMELGLVLARLGSEDKALPLLAATWERGDAPASVALALAKTYRDLGRLDDAQSVLETARAQHPEDHDVVLQLALLFEQRGDFDRAVVAYREVTRLRADVPEALDRAARMYIKLDMPDEAVQTLEQLLRARPNDAGAYFELGTAYGKLGNESDAIASYARAAELRPGHLATWVRLAQSYAKRGDLALAADAYRRALYLEPGAREETLELAAILERLGLNEERTQLLMNLTSARPDPEILLALARARGEEGKLDEAVRLFDAALDVTPIDIPAKLDAGAIVQTWALVSEGYRSNIEGARKVVQVFEALALSERTEPRFVVELAANLRELDRARTALTAVQRVAHDPAPPGAYRLKGLLLAELGQTEEAADAWAVVVRDEPKAADARWVLAQAYMALKRRSEALTALRVVVQLDPVHADAWSALGDLLVSAGDEYGAIEALTELVGLRPDGASYRRLSAAYTRAGRKEEAVEAIRSAIRAEPNAADHRRALGLAYAASEDPRAVEVLEEALRLDPELHEIRGVAARIHRAKKDHGAALVHLQALTHADAHSPETWRMLVESLVSMQRLPAAIEAIRRAIAASPADADLRRLHGTLAMQAKLWEEAASAFEAWLTEEPTDTEALAYLATCYQNLNRSGDALRALKGWVKHAPKRHEPHLELGLLLLARGDHRTALESLERARELRPDLPTAFMGIAEAQGALGDLEARAQALRSYVTLVDNSAQGHAMLGDTYDELGRTDDAVDSYARAVERDPRLHDKAERLAEIFAERRDWQTAAVYLRAVTAAAPTASRWLGLARAEQRLVRFDQALAAVEEALELDATSTDAQRLKAMLWADKNDVEPARAVLEELVRRDENDLESRFELARIYEGAHQYASARVHLRVVTARQPGHVEAQLLLARVFEAIENPKAAADAYAAAAAASPLAPDVLVSWAGCLLATNETKRAETVLREAIDVDPQNARAHVALGMLLYKAGRAIDAVDEFTSAIELSTDDAELHAALGAALSKANRPRDAAGAYARAIALGKPTPQMHFQLGVALTKAGDAQAARTHVSILEQLRETELASRLRAMLP